VVGGVEVDGGRWWKLVVVMVGDTAADTGSCVGIMKLACLLGAKINSALPLPKMAPQCTSFVHAQTAETFYSLCDRSTHFTALHCTALRSTTLHCTALRCTAHTVFIHECDGRTKTMACTVHTQTIYVKISKLQTRLGFA
jgi:hypothetical protein